ncbi:MAG: hypothetical protein F2933_04850, partial [Actinobacteria bacterium]|nr:hypothetical protein [Actinomycetota bacterium]
MMHIVFLSMLFAIPGALLLICEDDALSTLEVRTRSAAARSRDRSGIRA